MGENTSLFKVFRVLWFPVSINAMALGAAAVVLFWAGSWICALVAGMPEGMENLHADLQPTTSQIADTLTHSFPDRLLTVAEARSWPEIGPTGHFGVVFALQIVLFFFLWSTFGVAICRILALRIARDEYCALGSAFAFAWRVKLTGMLYPLAVMLPILFLLLCNQFAGVVTWIPGLGWVLGLLLLPLTIISSLLAVLIGIAGLVSLGFMPAAIATERKGTYDSLGKSFNYVFARAIPLILQLVILFYFLGFVHELFVEQRLVEGVVADSMLPLWEDSTSDFQRMVQGQNLDGFQGYCAFAYGAVMGLYRLLLWGALISFTFGAFTSLFLILRKDVDGVDYSDVARDPSDAPDVPETPAPPASSPAAEEAPENGPTPSD
ncbi:MAG: hypothetical protein HRU14_11745 [Planctomycetes bacterium]|nr:hypothetical protein [Planctomycetota bacterium]